MLYLVNLIILLVLFNFSLNTAWGQENFEGSSSQNYQDYLKMMESLNDLNIKYGMKVQIPLNEKKWKKLCVRDIENQLSHKNSECENNLQSNETY